MKKVIQPNVRKVYGPSQQQQEIQINAVRKINSLLSSGAVSVTGPTQPRILKQKITPPVQINVNNQQHQKCYICDDTIGSQGTLLTEAVTSLTHTKLPNKIGRVVGDAFMVIVSCDDVVCKRCVAMFNHMDRLETDLERLRNNVLNFIYKKYGITDDENKTTTNNSGSNRETQNTQPAMKVQKLNSGGQYVTRKVNQTIGDTDDMDETIVRKINATIQQKDNVENQLSTLFEGSPAENRNNLSNLTVPALVRTTNNTASNVQRKAPIKIYKCMSCEFKTTDLKQFQPHYETCRQPNAHQCKICRKVCVSAVALKQHTLEKHPVDQTCNFCSVNFLSEMAYKKHMEISHPDIKLIETATTGQMYSCNMCQYKTSDKQNYDDHLRKHIKVKPFKCRICSMRFETREHAAKHAKSHQPDYFKCGACSISFPQRDMLMKHFEVHQKPQQNTSSTAMPAVTLEDSQQITVTSANTQQVVTTQKLLQETIDEALRDSGDGLEAKGIHFFSCNICSLTFIQESYYNQHMEAHKRENKKQQQSAQIVHTTQNSPGQSLIRQDVRNTNATILSTQTNSISDADLESIFEKMHSDKSEIDVNQGSGDNLVITSQENSVGGITFNITIPQQQEGGEIQLNEDQKLIQLQADENTTNDTPTGIDMPVLDPTEEAEQQHQQQQQDENGTVSGGPPVSMPSLEDDNDSQSQPSNIDSVPMELEDMQNSVEGEQIKFILNENGQLLQLDNHIITTDADGNQIIVQGADSEHLQQLLQSVAGLEGGTIQMIGDNNQMILVQQGDNEPQLIDASLLNADGHIVIQQSQDGDISGDGQSQNSEDAQIPVSVAFTTHSQQLQSVEDNSQGEVLNQIDDNLNQEDQQIEQHHVDVHQEEEEEEEEEEVIFQSGGETLDDVSGEKFVKEDTSSQNNINQQCSTSTETTTTATTVQTSIASGEVFFNLEDLMQQSEQK